MIFHVLLAVLICLSIRKSSCRQKPFRNIYLSKYRSLIDILCIILVENDLICFLKRSIRLLLRLFSNRCFLLLDLILDLACAELDIAVTLHSGTSRDQLTDNNILFQTDQVIDLTVDRSLSKNLCGLLEGCGG